MKRGLANLARRFPWPRTWGRGTAMIVLLLLLAGAVPARAERTVWLATRPGRATLVEASAQAGRPGRVLAPLRDTEDECVFRFGLDPGTPHHFELRRPPYDPIQFTLVARADSWWMEGDVPGRVIHSSPGNVETIRFARSLRFNVTPPGAVACRPMRPGDATGVDVGLLDRMVPYPVREGRVIVDRAYDGGVVFLCKPMFAPFRLEIPKGALGLAGGTYPELPVRLSPMYGPFSYWQFQVAMLVAGGGGVGAWLFVFLPRARRRRAEAALEMRLASEIMAKATDSLAGDRDLPPLLGQVLHTEGGEPFMIRSLLGRGAMGAVFEAVSARPDARVDEVWAIKVLFRGAADDRVFLERFQREARVCSTIPHPGIVRVIDWGVHGTASGDHPFMVMQRVRGVELREVIRRSAGTMPAAEALGYVAQILRALGAAHAAQVVHRDLKPENIMVTSDRQVKIMDFGLARELDQKSLTQSSTTLGTPRYMSPEHLQAKSVVPASDLYAVGVMLYEMLSGKPPFDAPDAWSLLTQMLTATPAPLERARAGLPPNVVAFTMKLMARSIDERYRSAEEALDALSRLGGGWAGWKRGRA